MKPLTLAELSTKLIELESHPGLEHLRRYSPTGVTARRWAIVEPLLGQLWDDLAELRRLGDSGRQGSAVESMSAAFADVTEFLDAVDAVNEAVATGIAPSLRKLDATGAAIPLAITDLLTVSAIDPMSLTNHDIEHRITTITELVAVQMNWSAAVAATAVRLDALRVAVRQAAQTRELATMEVLAGPLPASAEPEPRLRAELDSMAGPDPAALVDLQRRVHAAADRAHHDERLAQGLLDRRAELAGRLRAYEAKAARLGLAQDPEVVSSGRIASGLLSRRPCDLRAVTRAVGDYRQLVSLAREKTR